MQRCATALPSAGKPSLTSSSKEPVQTARASPLGDVGSWRGIGDRLSSTQDWAGPPVVGKTDDPYRIALNSGRRRGSVGHPYAMIDDIVAMRTCN